MGPFLVVILVSSSMLNDTTSGLVFRWNPHSDIRPSHWSTMHETHVRITSRLPLKRMNHGSYENNIWSRTKMMLFIWHNTIFSILCLKANIDKSLNNLRMTFLRNPTSNIIPSHQWSDGWRYTELLQGSRRCNPVGSCLKLPSNTRGFHQKTNTIESTFCT